MKAKNTFAALLLLVAGLQTAWAQGFRVYKSDGTVAQFSLRTDSIVFYDGIGSDQDFGPFTPVNQCVVGTWYKSKSETITFNEDGTTDYIAGGTYKFLPYQGTIVICNANGAPMSILKVHDVTAGQIIVSTLGSTTFSVWSTTPLPQRVTSITLSETSVTLMPDETKTLTATVLPADAENPVVEWTSSDESVAEVNKNGRIIANADGTCVITCAATDGSGVKAECKVTVGTSGGGNTDGTANGHDYVEIGGLKWATMNVGATTVAGSYETCFGDYYAWGETQPRYLTITRSDINSASFTWGILDADGYSSKNYPTYKGTTLDASHDAATANWGGTWRTPTQAEFVALAEACSGSSANETPVTLISTIIEGGIYWLSSTQTIESAYTGVAGILFVSANDISKRVFFPASGDIDGTSIKDGGTRGRYWSSSRDTWGTSFAYLLEFHSSYVGSSGNYYRYYGLTVRPVSD